MSIKYACIYKYDSFVPSLILEFPESNNNKFKETMVTIFNTISPKKYIRQIIEDNNYNYTYFNNCNYLIGCVSDKECRYRIIQNFIKDISNNLSKNKITINLLKDLVSYYGNLNNDKVTKIQISIDNAKNIMTDNIEKTLERCDKIDTMQTKSNTLVESAEQFDSKANDLKKEFCWRNLKMIIMIIFVLFILISIIILMSCGANLKKC